MTEAKIFCKYDALLDPKSLTPSPDNPNDHDEAQQKRLGKLIKKGWRAPIIVSKNSKFIVKGHGTTLAAIKAKMDKVPVVFQEFDSPESEYAFLVSDNAIADWAKLDFGKINDKLADLGPDFDLEDFGIKDFGLDPPPLKSEKGATADGVESTNGGGINCVRLFYSPEEYSDLLAKADALMEAHEVKDMSQLFKALVDERHEALR